ncbi:MAG: hypothetical protein ABI824_06795 [Acidobacteriota bacterium]
MAGRGPTSFQKRQKEEKRKEKQQEKLAKKEQRKTEPGATDDEATFEEQVRMVQNGILLDELQ